MNKFKVVSFNVQSWNTSKQREQALISKIKSLNADLIGLQEVTPYWNSAIFDNFSKDYYLIGDYRLSCLEADPWNEKSPLLVKKILFNIVDESTFWLSSTPKTESIAKDCKYPRVCTYAILEEKESKLCFVFANTHLDHLSSIGRENECKFLIKCLKDKLGKPFILTGDFNSESSDDSYLLIKKYLNDSKFLFNKIDNTWTWHNNENPDKKMIIDYIFINEKIEALRYFVDTDTNNGKDISDHRPVVLEIKIKK